MAFVKKVWKDRIAEYINRRLLTKEDGTQELVTVARNEGNISQEGDAFNAANMNNLEERIANEFQVLNEGIGTVDGIFGSMDATTYADYPTGFTSKNCVIIALQAYYDADYIITAGMHDIARVALSTNHIIVVLRDESFAGKPYKLLLQKIAS